VISLKKKPKSVALTKKAGITNLILPENELARFQNNRENPKSKRSRNINQL
jgi:hypothetical protein